MKVCFYDLETLPIEGYTWSLWETNVLAIKKGWRLASFAYSWAGETKVRVHSLRTEGSEKALVKKLHQVLSSADILVAHNGKQFDDKKASAKFIEYGLPPPKPYQSIDTRQVAKRYFMFDSNKLDDLGMVLKVGRKAQTGGFSLWLGCIANKKASWLKMEGYNKQDVRLLKRVYYKLRPWITNHPNLSRASGCPNCGSRKLKSNGVRITKTQTYRQMRCLSCHAYSRERVALQLAKPKVVSL